MAEATFGPARPAAGPIAGAPISSLARAAGEGLLRWRGILLRLGPADIATALAASVAAAVIATVAAILAVILVTVIAAI